MIGIHLIGEYKTEASMPSLSGSICTPTPHISPMPGKMMRRPPMHFSHEYDVTLMGFEPLPLCASRALPLAADAASLAYALVTDTPPCCFNGHCRRQVDGLAISRRTFHGHTPGLHDMGLDAALLRVNTAARLTLFIRN